MTPSEAIKRWNLNAGNINAGKAVDFICPKCGYRAQFTIGANGIVVIDGTGEITSFTFYKDFEPDHHCECNECGHPAQVRDFKCKGLDKLLTKMTGLSEPCS